MRNLERKGGKAVGDEVAEMRGQSPPPEPRGLMESIPLDTKPFAGNFPL